MQVTTEKDMKFKTIQQRYGEDASYASLEQATFVNNIANDVQITDVLALAELAKIARDNIRFLISALRGCQKSQSRFLDKSHVVVNFYNYELEALIRHNLVYAWRHYRIIHKDYVLHFKSAMQQIN